MLGTNDLKARFSLSASDIAAGAGALVDIVPESEAGPDGGAPMVLLVAPRFTAQQARAVDGLDPVYGYKFRPRLKERT